MRGSPDGEHGDSACTQGARPAHELPHVALDGAHDLVTGAQGKSGMAFRSFTPTSMTRTSGARAVVLDVRLLARQIWCRRRGSGTAIPAAYRRAASARAGWRYDAYPGLVRRTRRSRLPEHRADQTTPSMELAAPENTLRRRTKTKWRAEGPRHGSIGVRAALLSTTRRCVLRMECRTVSCAGNVGSGATTRGRRTAAPDRGAGLPAYGYVSSVLRAATACARQR